VRLDVEQHIFRLVTIAVIIRSPNVHTYQKLLPHGSCNSTFPPFCITARTQDNLQVFWKQHLPPYYTHNCTHRQHQHKNGTKLREVVRSSSEAAHKAAPTWHVARHEHRWHHLYS